MEKEEVLHQRAEILAKKIEDEVDLDSLFTLLEFQLGDERYAIEVEYVKEVLPFDVCTTLPQTSPFFLGVISIRQKIISVYNLKKRLNLENSEEKIQGYVVVLEKDGVELAVLVDSVVGNTILPKTDLQEPPQTFSEEVKELLLGVTLNKLILLNPIILLKNNTLC
ncbi:MAG: chemotaxis protein CheW [Simkaniaceae bacterium]|nr:chemotaxis protein CheW [Simkaniaceae bacterium]